VTAMSGSAASKLVGEYLVLESHKVRFAGTSCDATLQETSETSAEFFEEFKAELRPLNLPDPVKRLDGGCTEIFISASNKIVFSWKGYFLEAARANFR